MLNLLSVLKHVSSGIQEEEPRYIVQDDEHILDMKSGVLFHVYDNWFKLTYEDKNVITKDDFTVEEQEQFWEIKKLITAQEKLLEMKENYKPLQIERRNKMSDLFENPVPVNPLKPVEEEGTTTYIG